MSKSPGNINRRELRLIAEPHGEPVGFFAHYPELRPDGSLIVTWYDVSANLWSAVTPSVLRYLGQTGEAYAQQSGTPFSAYTFYLGGEHPVYQVIPDRLPQIRKPYAWYLRVPDLPAFIRTIRPVLEQRLTKSPFATQSNELRITFYRQGLRLKLECGRLEEIAPWQPAPQAHSGAAGFPGLTFLQLVFGYRSLAELQAAFPDCWTENENHSGCARNAFPEACVRYLARILMLTLGVVADTHVPDRVRRLNPAILESLQQAGVQAILHAGDVTTGAVLEQLAEIAPVEAVRGDRDWVSLRKLPETLHLKFAGREIVLTHGHGGWLRYGFHWARYLIWGYQARFYLSQLQRAFPRAEAVVFGHTHRPLVFERAGQIFLNPGSAHGLDVPHLLPSLGLLHIPESGNIQAEICWLNRKQAD